MYGALDEAKNRVKLLKAGYNGKEIEHLAITVFAPELIVVRVNWQGK